jgi:hypothetical protein
MHALLETPVYFDASFSLGRSFICLAWREKLKIVLWILLNIFTFTTRINFTYITVLLLQYTFNLYIILFLYYVIGMRNTV